MKSSKIALVGASGALGTGIAAALKNQRVPYRVIGRSRAPLETAFGGDPQAEIVLWNPDDAVSISAALTGIETVVYLVGVPYDQFQLHPVLLRATLDGAIAAGVSRFLLIGTVYPFGRPQSTPVTEAHPRTPHTYRGRMRKEQEDLLLAADAEGRIRGAILRLPDFYGPNVERSFLHGIFQGAVSGKRAQVIGPIDVPHEYIFIPDVGPVVSKLIATPEAFGRTWNLGGVGTITQAEVAAQAYRAVGREPKLFVANKLLLRLMGLFNPLMRGLAEMHYLLTSPVVLDDRALQTLIGPIAKTSYAEGIRESLRALQVNPKNE